MSATLHDRIARTLDLQPARISAALALFDEGNTVPFVARYRKERTGHLDETQLRAVQELAESLRKLDQRRASILGSLTEQGKLTGELRGRIERAATLTELEDLYAPFKPRRLTRARKAAEAGLQPVAEAIEQGRDPMGLARKLTSKAFPTPEDAIRGAQDILAEAFADTPSARRQARETLRRHGVLVCRKRRGAEPDPTYADYLDFSAPVQRLRPHQVLAIRRGEHNKALSASVRLEGDRLLGDLVRRRVRGQGRVAALHRDALTDGYQRLLLPGVERDLRRELDEEADAHAIGVFAINLRNLLLAAPLPGKRVLGVDPGYRTGCKLAVVDAGGQVLDTSVVYVHDRRRQQAPRTLRQLLDRHRIDVIAIGDGTASAEAQEAVAEAIDGTEVRYAVVSEAGASVYSASELAVEELPDLDVSLRGAVSIARRLQDPLAELVKIDPRSIGVGMYQHDVDQGRLSRALDGVVEDAVNAVGVDLRSASKRLLTYVAGIGPTLADRIVAYRQAHGLKTRRDLRKVKGIGDRAFQQCAGFLRIHGGPEPLDATPIHPESYPAARAILAEAGVGPGDRALPDRIEALRRDGTLQRLADRFSVGRFTLDDLVEGLTRPGRDPREDVEPPVLRARQLSMDELKVGTRLTGTVRNVVDFGAFVDIGLKNDGLVHISKLARWGRGRRDPHAVVAVGDRVEVTVVSVDRDRGRIGLSMIEG